MFFDLSIVPKIKEWTNLGESRSFYNNLDPIHKSREGGIIFVGSDTVRIFYLYVDYLHVILSRPCDDALSGSHNKETVQ